VQLARLLFVGLVDFLEGGGALDAQEVVEGYVGTFIGDDFVADAEDFPVCSGDEVSRLYNATKQI